MQRATALFLGAALALCAGCDTVGTPMDPFDGSFIAGDADEPEDSGPDGGFLDAEPEDTGPDAGPPDVGPADTGPGDAGDPCLEAMPEATVTASQARAQAGVLAGRVVALTGTATTGALQCTDMACSDEDPCCNTCVAPIHVGGVTLAGSECFDPPPQCAGSECGQVCRPPVLGLPQTFFGVLSTAAPDLQLLLYRVR